MNNDEKDLDREDSGDHPPDIEGDDTTSTGLNLIAREPTEDEGSEGDEAEMEMEDVLEIGIPIAETPAGEAIRTAEAAAMAEDPTDAPETPPPSDDAPSASLVAAIGMIQSLNEKMESLAGAFESKLKYDLHKNKIIDDLHQALQLHREGILKKYLHRIIMDVIKIVDDMRKFTSHYANLPPSPEISEKLLKFIDQTAVDLEDLFSWEGVFPFTCEGRMLDLSRQRVLNKIPTPDPEKDKTIAERLRPGYESDGKVIRPEMVSVFVYQPKSTPRDDLLS